MYSTRNTDQDPRNKDSDWSDSVKEIIWSRRKKSSWLYRLHHSITGQSLRDSDAEHVSLQHDRFSLFVG